jgi:hypothetical protein
MSSCLSTHHTEVVPDRMIDEEQCSGESLAPLVLLAYSHT